MLVQVAARARTPELLEDSMQGSGSKHLGSQGTGLLGLGNSDNLAIVVDNRPERPRQERNYVGIHARPVARWERSH